jgi:hypothetical protein
MDTVGAHHALEVGDAVHGMSAAHPTVSHRGCATIAPLAARFIKGSGLCVVLVLYAGASGRASYVDAILGWYGEPQGVLSLCCMASS